MIVYGPTDPDTGASYGIAWNFPDVYSAMLGAEKECYGKPNVMWCELRSIARNACAAVVSDRFSHEFGTGLTKEAAIRDAMEKACRNCKVIVAECSTKP